MRRTAASCGALVLTLWAAAAGAAEPAAPRTLALSGRFGDKALLVIDGQARTVAVGARVQGVRLLQLGDGTALVEVGGERRTLALGAPVDLGAAGPAAGTIIVLNAGSGGHYWADGAIDGKAVRFLVDTGASSISMSQSQAARLGIAFRDAPRLIGNTANGQVIANRVKLGSVRVGEVTLYDIDAVVVPATMDFVLLGNSFLSRFQMRQENDVMTLTRRY